MAYILQAPRPLDSKQSELIQARLGHWDGFGRTSAWKPCCNKVQG